MQFVGPMLSIKTMKLSLLVGRFLQYEFGLVQLTMADGFGPDGQGRTGNRTKDSSEADILVGTDDGRTTIYNASSGCVLEALNSNIQKGMNGSAEANHRRPPKIL